MQSKPFDVRPAGPADCDEVLRCLQRAFEPFRRDYTPGAYADTVLTLETAEQRIRTMHVLVAVEVPTGVIGTISWARESNASGHLRGMAVVPERQGTGVAQALLERALDDLRASGARHVTLDTTRPLTRAMRFYERNGFHPTGRVADFFGMPLLEFTRELQV